MAILAVQYNSLKHLDWDSHFFGYPVSKIVFDHRGIGMVDEVFREIHENNFRLVYLFVPSDDNELNRVITDKGGRLFDNKVLFVKKPEAHDEFKNPIQEYGCRKPDDKLIELGLEAGLFSRFRLDNKFVNCEFERLYTRWVTDSVSGLIAFKVIVAVSGNDVIGITTIGEKNGSADIGLVAVDRNHTGKGFGYDMIRYADDVAYGMKFDRITVVTQMKNTAACRLYKKCNFVPENITNVYHFWQY
ncbi:MAG: GNAT family N-acetyltransferase [Bacteroidales bacterium]|nr:GNAT family N-acetyltransferase [Bacteroidales bacterium]